MIAPRSCSDPASLHIITGLWRHTGGPAETVPALCGGLAKAASRASIAVLAGDMADAVHDAARAGVNVRIFAATIRHTVWYSRSLQRCLPALVAAHDIVHAHAMWQAPGWMACEEAMKQGRPFVLSPRGSLLPQRLAKSRLKKRLASLFFDGRNVRRCALMHATSTEEAESIRSYGYRGPIAVIPNGIDVPDDSALLHWREHADAFRARFPETAGKRLLLFLSRIEPIKGVTSLASAWGEIAHRHPDWHLVIAGPVERNHVQEVTGILAARGVAGRTTLAGPLYGEDRERAFASSEAFVLPTKSENFGMVIGESLARGVPVITTVGAPWPGLVDRACGWWIPHGEHALTACLDEALTTPACGLREMGARGRLWMQKDFAWPAICGRMRDVYRWLLGQASQKPTDTVLYR